MQFYKSTLLFVTGLMFLVGVTLAAPSEAIHAARVADSEVANPDGRFL